MEETKDLELSFDAIVRDYLDHTAEIEDLESKLQAARESRDALLSKYPELAPIHGLKRRYQRDGWAYDGKAYRFPRKPKGAADDG